MSLPTRGSVSPYRRHTFSSFPPSPAPRQLRLKTSSSTPSQERNSNDDAGPRVATHLQTPPWQSVLHGTPPAADPVGPWPPPETTRRTVKDDWPNSHPADLRSRHAILLGASRDQEDPILQERVIRTWKQILGLFSSAISLQHAHAHSLPLLHCCATRITHPHEPPRLARLSASPQPPHAQVSECLNTGTRSPRSSLLAPQCWALSSIVHLGLRHPLVDRRPETLLAVATADPTTSTRWSHNGLTRADTNHHRSISRSTHSTTPDRRPQHHV